ncbi:MAG: L-seryl-tRNA(Ser) seleniumtransferase [Blastocatellia bacterium]|jgi:L-seryl-tRNA(Ser) seleniumtransferase|nr:L-seryl-tRNA(Ser) seleniumtransferase [Blastocatellia bacterium]
MSRAAESNTASLRLLPSVDALLRTPAAQRLKSVVGARRLTTVAREVTDKLRSEVRTTDSKKAEGAKDSRETLLAEATHRLELACRRDVGSGMRRVINATGVVLHTNLGRAPLSAEARRMIAGEAAGYCTLEYDLENAARGRRGGRVEELLCELTGAEAALMVNNCAAAALLVLNVLASDGETIVSRGELVEIGGDFRVPDVMASSGTRMIEVGTTNRTRLADYQKVISDKTRLIMRVHTSNYRIVGFTNTPSLAELSELAHSADLPLYEDAGSGALLDFSLYGLTGEPLISESIAAGADVVSFSGDKLLGGPQAGLIVGRATVIESLRKHPMYRALRADKLALAALEATLAAYRRDDAVAQIPTLRMIALSTEEIGERAEALRVRVGSDSGLMMELVEGESAIGGGSAPTTNPKTVLVALSHPHLSSDAIEAALRHSGTPVIARIAEGRVLLDLRTVAVEEEPELIKSLSAVS